MNAREQASLAIRLMGREIASQSSRLAFYAACLALGVAAIAAVSGFSAQVQETVRRNSRLLLGGDVEIRDVRALAPGLLQAARSDSATRAHALVDEFVAMARTASQSAANSTEEAPSVAPTEARLVSVHAVEGTFPLVKSEGGIVTDPPGALDDSTRLRGKAIVDADLARAWNLRPGDTIEVSGARLGVAALLVDDPARDFTSLALGPRVYIHRDDALAAKLVGNTSRFRERLLLSVAPGTDLDAMVKRLENAAKQQGTVSPRVSHHEVNAGTSTRPLRNLGFFLAQVALSTLVLTGLGATSGLGEYLRTRLPDVAIYRAMGARPLLPTLVLLGVVSAVAGTGVAAGLALGEAFRLFVLIPLVGGLLPLELADVAGTGAALDIAAATFGTLVLLCVPVLLALQRTSPADVLRGLRDTPRGSRVAVALTALAATGVLAALFVRHAPNPRAGLLLFGATVVLFVVFRALARGLVSLFSRYETRLPLALRLSLAEIAARKETAVLSMALAGLSLFLTCLVQFVKDDLLTPLGDTSVRGKPNLYLVDVQPSQKAGVEAALKERNGGGAVYASPMVRARLVRVNADETNAAQGEASSGGEVMGGPPQEGLARSPEEEAARSRRREQNLTYRHSLGDGERVLERVEGAPPAPEGHIWDPAGGARAEVSIEREFAGRARIALGDELTFDVQGIPVKARVTSLRSVTWQNWRPNFFMVVHPSLLSDAPQMNLVATNVAAAEDRRALTRELAGSFPNVSVLDAAAIVKRVAELSTGVAEATRFLATLLLGASLLVLAAGLVSTRRTRLRHYAVIRSLGGKNGLLSASLVLEFLWLAGVSGALGVVAAAVVARVFSETFLDLDASLSLAPALYLFAGYLVVNVVVGWLSCASVLRRKPSEVLREGI